MTGYDHSFVQKDWLKGDFSDRERSKIDFLDNKGFSPASIAQSLKRPEGAIVGYLYAKKVPPKNSNLPPSRQGEEFERPTHPKQTDSHRSRKTEATKPTAHRVSDQTPPKEMSLSKASKPEMMKEETPTNIPETTERICFSCGKIGSSLLESLSYKQ